MLSQLSPVDITVLILMLLIMPTAGVIVAWRKKSAEQYFLAGRSIRWWTVAGSVFGTNISSFHLIGMLGVGYSIGFVQAHYEIVFPAILLICYVFLASYRKLGLFTLSRYLEIRYNEAARLVYTILLVLIILVQLVGAFYVGSITLQWLFGGAHFSISYPMGLLLIGLITCSYTIWGGMESVVITDSIQTLMMLAAGITVAFFTFSQPEINGFMGLLALDGNQPLEAQKMRLYLPTDHPNLPWTGIFTGLMLQHAFNFSTNQFIVQRALAASSDEDARKGLIASGFLKLTIPFFSIATGIAAYYLFQSRFGQMDFNSDNTFLKLVETVIPSGVGLHGMILAGLTAATFSSVDSMMNAATTLLSVDVYQKYVHPEAREKQLLRFSRLAIVGMVVLSIAAALYTYTPDRSNNFFLRVSAQLSYFTPGIMAAFFYGAISPRASARGAVLAMVLVPVFGVSLEWAYKHWLHLLPGVEGWLGPKLNFMHRIACSFLFGMGVIAVFRSSPEAAKESGYHRLDLHLSAQRLFRRVGGFLLLQLVFVAVVYWTPLSARQVAPLAALAILAFLPGLLKGGDKRFWQDDRFYAGLLVAASVWMYFFFA